MNFNSVLSWVADNCGADGSQPFVLGLNGPQGAGKSTLSNALCRALETQGRYAVAISIDDFYFTRTEQIALAESHPDNPYLQQRGYPGTHDVELGDRIVDAIKNFNPTRPVALPRYDKSAFQGKGDRAPQSEWPTLKRRPDLVIFEGWMLGFTPVPEVQLPNSHFRTINQYLERYSIWHRHLDGFLRLKPEEIRFFIDWRVEAEEKMKASGREGMSREDITRYAELFLPAYETYLPWLEQHPPVEGKPLLLVPIGRERLPV